MVLNDETIFTSPVMKPGESLDSFTLEKPLAAGTYEALAVTTVTDAKGEKLFANRVPVTLNVH